MLTRDLSAIANLLVAFTYISGITAYSTMIEIIATLNSLLNILLTLKTAELPTIKNGVSITFVNYVLHSQLYVLLCIKIVQLFDLGSNFSSEPYVPCNTGRSGLMIACLTAVREVPGSNRAVGSCVYRTTTVIYSLGHRLCAPFLQCLGQLSLLSSVGR